MMPNVKELLCRGSMTLFLLGETKMMNNSRQISAVIVDDSQLEAEFTCLVEFGEWRIKIEFRFHATARCVRVTASKGDTERCVNLRSDLSVGTSGFNTAHLLLTDNQIPCAHGLDFQALQHGIAVADWISRFLCLTAEKPAACAREAIEKMCTELGSRLANGGRLLGSCL